MADLRRGARERKQVPKFSPPPPKQQPAKNAQASKPKIEEGSAEWHRLRNMNADLYTEEWERNSGFTIRESAKNEERARRRRLGLPEAAHLTYSIPKDSNTEQDSDGLYRPEEFQPKAKAQQGEEQSQAGATGSKSHHQSQDVRQKMQVMIDEYTARNPEYKITSPEAPSDVPSEPSEPSEPPYSPYLKDPRAEVNRFNIRYFKKRKPLSYYRRQHAKYVSTTLGADTNDETSGVGVEEAEDEAEDKAVEAAAERSVSSGQARKKKVGNTNKRPRPLTPESNDDTGKRFAGYARPIAPKPEVRGKRKVPDRYAVSALNILDEGIDASGLVDIELLRARPARKHLTRGVLNNTAKPKGKFQANDEDEETSHLARLRSTCQRTRQEKMVISDNEEDDEEDDDEEEGNEEEGDEEEGDDDSEIAPDTTRVPHAQAESKAAAARKPALMNPPPVPDAASCALPSTPIKPDMSRPAKAKANPKPIGVDKAARSGKGKGPVAGHFFPPPLSSSPRSATTGEASSSPMTKDEDRHKGPAQAKSPPSPSPDLGVPFTTGKPEPHRLSAVVWNKYTGRLVRIHVREIRVGEKVFEASRIDWNDKDHIDALNQVKNEKLRWATKDPNEALNQVEKEKLRRATKDPNRAL
ncbi:MAG: hypothetical protein M1822_009107 [Bathelium mastoideum]|nr:MAG: hypothetical protein M1822_009107 [Bathelium mastoideum]